MSTTETPSQSLDPSLNALQLNALGLIRSQVYKSNHRLIQYIETHRPNDLCLNGHQECFVDFGSGLTLLNETFFSSAEDFKEFVIEQISLSGKTWDAKLPFVDTTFFGTYRAHVGFPPLSRNGICVSLRKLPASHRTANVLEYQTQAFTRWNKAESKDDKNKGAFELLVTSILKHETILICGGTGSGKTTLLNDLLSFAKESERMVALEDVPELQPHHPHYVSLVSRSPNADGMGAVTLRDLLKQTLRMRPDRILLGECRGGEVLDLLQALNTGHQGTLATLHANSARDALRRLELLTLIGSNGTLPLNLTRELIAHGIQKVVYLKNKTICEIASITGKEGDAILLKIEFQKT